MSEPLKLGVAGLGTVGSSLCKILQDDRDHITAMAGRPVEVAAVSARDKARDRGFSISGLTWHESAVDLAKDPAIDVFVELIGGEDGIVKDAVEAAIANNKHIVTANKALLAKHGVALAVSAERAGVALNFEAAVAGGIPVIKTLREALAANKISRLYGILNGTCNYILSKMQDEGLPFDLVLKDAQDKGYAEADPTFDIGGFDAAHKLSILTTLAYGCSVDFEDIHVEGIQSVTADDIDAADELGYRIKLLAVAQKTDAGIEVRVHPAMVAKHSAVAEVSGVTNCVAIDGNHIGNLLLVGPGAGGDATASAVASDIVDIARNLILPPFIRPASKLSASDCAALGSHQGAYYVRMSVVDRPGAMAAIAKCMADEDVSIESIVQHRPKTQLPGTGRVRGAGEAASVIMITHKTTEKSMRDALTAIAQAGKVTEPPQMIRIEVL